MTTRKSEYDIYRDSYLRYLGYANEVGESFRPLVPVSVVYASYVAAISYVLADVQDKAVKQHKSGATFEKTITTAGDAFIWQMFASVIVPGFTINRITWFAGHMLRNGNFRKEVTRYLPTIIGLTSIPFIIHPIDHMIDYIMDRTYRKIF